MRSSWLLAAAFALVSLFAAEAFLRAFHPAPSYGVTMLPWARGLFEYDPRLGWRGRPDLRDVDFSADMFRVHVSHDSHGHRSTLPQWDPSRRNALVLGDSQGWGWGVEDDEVFSERMAALAPEWNVYNLSVPGYGTDQQLLALRRWLRGHPEAPIDAVLLLFSTNDFVDVGRARSDLHAKPFFVLEGDGPRLQGVPVPREAGAFQGRREPSEPDPGWLHRSHLWNLFEWNAGLLLGTARVNPHPVDGFSAGFDLVVALIEEIGRAAAERGASLHVVVLPAKREEIPWARLDRELNERGIPSRVLARRMLPRNMHWRDGHLNRRGHEQLALAFLESLEGAGTGP